MGTPVNEKEYLCNQHMLGENRLPARTQLLPSSKRGVTYKNPEASDRIKILSGNWKFYYSVGAVPAGFEDPGFDDSGWDILPVPSMWQFHGYGTCYYPNVRYCFPYDPPYIHKENPVGLYRRTFTASPKEGEKSILRFLGVDNAYFVWLNGRYVGFSKGSRIPAEFDVTPFLREGENLLAVKVYTYSDASYLENQDMLMASGIFRDVMLVTAEGNSLWDYTLLPDETGFTVKYKCFTKNETANIRFTLCDADGKVCSAAEQSLSAQGETFLPLKNAVTWNAEAPYLYTVYIELIENGVITETHTKKAGIAESSVEGIYLKMNGRPITLKGVNRHENNCRTGRAITAAQIEEELKDIKSCNLNAIRTSHYTNHPLFYELCSELGIYVMDEADCESHGAEATGDQGALNKDPEWFDAFFDRVSRMYLNDKNETCINLWSLGNECGTGENNTRCVDWLLQQDVKKPVKDMSECHTEAPEQFVLSGYMPMQTLYDSSPEEGHPLLLVEYGHAMGNSPGGLEDIWNWIYENDHCCGGYVWEFKSHGFYVEGKNGRPRYLYGGDFPDLYHWSNFSLDGYHTSNGAPKPTWAELKEVSAPAHVIWDDCGVTVKNTRDFLSFEKAVMHWRVCADGVPVHSGSETLNGLKARECRFVPLPLNTDGLTGLVTADCEFFENGASIGHKQKILADIDKTVPAPVPFAHTVTKEDAFVRVMGESFTVELENGILSTIVKDGKVLLDAPMRLNCWRAPTDNDGIIGFEPRLAGEWERYLVHSMRFGCYMVDVLDAPDTVTVTAKGKFLPESHWWGFETVITYRILSDCAVYVTVHMTPYGSDRPKVLPRVGVYFELDAAYGHCRWLGRGPGENYPDCKANAPVGIYEADVREMRFPYDVPQESGNHGDCRVVTVSGADRSLTVTGKFSFSFHNVTLKDLTKARHFDELEESEHRYLYIDHLHRGLGSNSCGPQPEAQYELPLSEYRWSFCIEP